MTSAATNQIAWFSHTFSLMTDNVGRAVLGKEHVIRLAVTCLVSNGHLLLEDFPGTGKTSLAKSLANTLQGTTNRIQFTPDLLPSDVTGVTIYDQAEQTFVFHPGPIFSTIVLADEINRASPKTQSALLEVMEEGKVTVDGISHPVGYPFMVVATQNPIEQAGTYRLPEAQLDRFLMKTSVGYPDRASTIAVLRGSALRDRSSAVHAVITPDIIGQMSDLADQVFIADSILDYISAIADSTREHKHVRLGLSVRGCVAYVRCVKTWAASKGRSFVTPDDVKELARPIMEHRVLLDADAEFGGATVAGVIDEIFAAITPPIQRNS